MNLRQISSKLSPRGWLMVGGSAAAVVVFAYLLFSMASAPSYTTLMAGVDPAQTGKITQALSTAGIAYQIENNGTAIGVQSDQEAQARVALAGQGLLSSSSTSSGASSLSNLSNGSSLGQSNFQQQVAYQAALEQQLQSTIENIQGISSAQVQLALPDQSQQLFTGSSQQPSAAVLINDAGSLSGSSVKGIADLVANSVPGLSDQKVTITDQTGQLLWPSSSAGASTALLSKESAQAAYDGQVAAQVNGMLAATLGPGKATVQVNADLNTNQTTVDSLSYAKKGVPLTAQTTNETLQGAGANGGVAGTNTGGNIPSYTAAAGNNSKYANKTTNITYGVNKTVTHSVISPGNINRQTVSVLVDKSVPASEIPNIRQAVEAAVGFTPKRGDLVNVNQIAFKGGAPATTSGSSSSTKMLGYAKYGAVGLGALLFLLFVGRLLRKRESEAFTGTPTWLRELESPRSLAALEAEHEIEPPTLIKQLRSPVNVAKQQVEDLVDRDPDRVASQVRAWMTED